MAEKGNEIDYQIYQHKGQKLTGPQTLEEKTKGALNQPPRIRTTVVRKVGRKPVNQSVVTQIGFDNNLEETRVMQVMSTLGGRRRLKNITPIEQDEINQSLLGINDPEIAKKARAQRAAIRSHPKKP